MQNEAVFSIRLEGYVGAIQVKGRRVGLVEENVPNRGSERWAGTDHT